MSKVKFELIDQVVRDVTTGFTGWSADTRFSTELCQFKTSPGKGKDFYRIQPEGDAVPVIIKVFPEQDGSMGMTEDSYRRELAFVGSELHQRLGEAVQMPQMAVQYTPDGIGILAMEDVSEELSLVGPPTPPTAELVRELITKIGKMHRLHWQQKTPDYDWLMDFKLWFEQGVGLLRMIVENEEQPLWAKAILAEQPGLIRGIEPFMDSLSEKERTKFLHILTNPHILWERIANVPVTIGHNDLFFTNIGLRDEQMLLIDWEFVGISPAPWDLSCSYAGMPPVGVDEAEMLELYFAQIPEATAEEKENWREGYHVMGAIEALIYGLRQLIPAVYDPQSKVPDEVKPRIEAEVQRVMEEVLSYT